MESNKIIKNTATLELELCGHKRTIESNETETNIVKLDIKKETNCKFVLAGGVVLYTITISNDSDVDLHDLEFKDTLANNTKYLTGSFKVNGVYVDPDVSGATLNYHIDKIKDNEDITITFEVKVL